MDMEGIVTKHINRYRRDIHYIQFRFNALALASKHLYAYRKDRCGDCDPPIGGARLAYRLGFVHVYPKIKLNKRVKKTNL